MALSAEEIFALYKSIETRLEPRFMRMRRVSAIYNGEVDLPLPSYVKIDQAAVPNLCEQGTDQIGRRIASVLPNMEWPSLHPGFKEPDERADLRRQVNYGWWERNRYPKVMRRRARWFITYSASPVVVRPSDAFRGPRWEMHHPMDAFPVPSALGSYTPDECILRHKRTKRWLQERYEQSMAALRFTKDMKPDDEFTCLEYITPEYVCLIACAPEVHNEFGGPGFTAGAEAVKLFEVENRIGMNWVVIPERDSLDAPKGQFDNIVGMYMTQAAMMAMHVHATIKAIWPERWLANPNGIAVPDVVQTPDPETGEPGIVVNGVLQDGKLDPSYRGLEVMDRLESSQRQTAALPPELGGTGGENVRTGRRGNQVMAASIDFTIAEAQDAFAESISEENIRAAAIDRAWYDERKTFHVSWKGARGKVTYKPSDIWEQDAHPICKYPIAGTDLSDLVINGGQRVGMGTMSPQSFMEIDPLIDDVDAELQRIRFSGIEQAFFSALQAMAADPAGPWQIPDLVRFASKMIGQNMPWYEAAAELQQEKQEEQAEGAPQGAPETMPGLAMPGQGTEVPSTVPGLGPASEDVTALLSQLGVADQAIRMR